MEQTTPKGLCHIALALLLVTPLRSWATPTALNLIPTADVAGEGQLCVQVELDGQVTPLATPTGTWLLTTLGLGKCAEVGMDYFGGEIFLDAKVQLVDESPTWPRISLGATDLTRDGIGSNWYLAATKDLGETRLTVGYRDDGQSRLVVGGYVPLDEVWTVAADYATGPGGYATVGVSRPVADSLCALLYYARHNDDADADFIGLNLCWSCDLSGRGGD